MNCPRKRSGAGLLAALFSDTPGEEVAGVERDAKEIGGHEAELGGADADDAQDGAVDGRDDPALPQSFSEENGAKDGQDAGQIVQSNGVQKI